MESNVKRSVPLDQLHISLADFDCRSLSTGTAQLGAADCWLFVAVTGGSGRLSANGGAYRLAVGAAFVFPPGTPVEAINEGSGNLSMYRAAFRVGRVALAGPEDEAIVLPCVGEARLIPFSRAVDCLDMLHALGNGSTALERFKRNCRFQELLILILEAGQDRSDASDTRSAVERSIAYIRANFREEITLRKLTDLSGVGKSQYVRLFREQTGKSVTEFVTDLRITRAKELLATTADPLRDIARGTGFSDEYYFNRRFKQAVGLSPRQYWSENKRQPKIVALEYLGEMLALGVKPIGAARFLMEFAEEEDRRGVSDFDEGTDAVARIAAMRPDFVLGMNNRDEEMRERLSRIVNVETVQWEDDVFAHMRAIGTLVGREREAAAWIGRYEAKAETLRNRFKPLVGADETAVAFGIFRDFVCVFTDRNIGHTLYNVCGFRPPGGIFGLIADRTVVGALNIEPERMTEFDADRIFLLVHPDALARRRHREIMASRIWRRLTAVRAGRVIELDNRWFPYDAHTLEWEIEEAGGWLSVMGGTAWDN